MLGSRAAHARHTDAPAPSGVTKCTNCNQEVTTEKGVEYVEILDTSRYLNQPPTHRVRATYFCGIHCFDRFLKTGFAKFLENAVVQELQ